MKKFLAIAMAAAFLGTVAIADADARAGRSRGFGGSSYKSFGDRGFRSNELGRQNRMQGIQQPRQNQFNQNAPGQRSSWFQRNPLLSGLLGALGGIALFSMLGHLFNGMGSGGSLLLLLLLGGIGFMLFRGFMARRQPQLAYSGPGTVTPLRPMPAMGVTPGPAITLDAPAYRSEQVQDELSGIFFKVQEAWSDNDLMALREVCTEEVYGHFADDLMAMQTAGERNVLKNIVIRAFEVSEAWREDPQEFVTARIQARLIDYVECEGRIIEGDANNPTDFHEFWTFVRTQGEAWRLSAVNQPA